MTVFASFFFGLSVSTDFESGKERESRSRVLKEDIAKGVRKRENNSGGKIAQEGKREDRGNMMKPRCRGHIHDTPFFTNFIASKTG